MAVTNEQIQQWFQSNPNASDKDIYNAMQTFKVDPNQLTTAMNFDPNAVQQRYQAQQEAAAPQGLAALAQNVNTNQVQQTANTQGLAALVQNQTQAATPTYTNYSDQDMSKWVQDFATKNTQGAYNPDAYNVSQQLKDALVATNANPDQFRTFLNSGTTVPIYGGANAGGYNVNVKDFANEFDMATSKTPLVDANGRITLDATRATQAAQNELDTLFDPNRGSLMPIKNADFEVGGKYYGRIGERDKMIADWYNNPANQATIASAQKTVFDKYGVPTNMRLAPRAISSMLARNEVKPAAVVDPYGYATYEDYSAAQNAASLKAFQDKSNIYKKYGIDTMGKEDPQQMQSTSGQVSLGNLQAGLAGRSPQDAANFYGMTLENYNNALSGNRTRPMGQYQQVYGNRLLSPIEQIAAQTARSAGLGNPSPDAVALAKKYPEIFARASKEWANYLSRTFPKIR
jgi:hypothetical protein